jgi:hypothetical protein
LHLKFTIPGIMLAAIGLSVFVVVSQAGGSATPPYWSYAAKFQCGEFGKLIPASATSNPEGPVEPGNYQTAINVHNPSAAFPVAFNKKAVLLYVAGATNKPVAETAFEVPHPPRADHQASLGADQGMLIDCQDIRRVLLTTATAGGTTAPTYIEGWVIIQEPTTPPAGQTVPPEQLDVTANYTSHGYNCTPTATTAACTASTATREGFAQDFETIQPKLINS